MTIASPATSELKDLPFKQIMVFPPMEPHRITYEKVEKALKEYLLLQRVTILVAFPNFRDRMKLFRYWIRDWRHSNDWKAWILFCVTIMTPVFALISTIASIKTI